MTHNGNCCEKKCAVLEKNYFPESIFIIKQAWVIKKCKLKWFGHVSRPAGLAKTILQGIMHGGRRRGWQKKGWESHIFDWKGLKFCCDTLTDYLKTKSNGGKGLLGSGCPNSPHDYRIGAGAGARFLAVHCGTFSCYVNLYIRCDWVYAVCTCRVPYSFHACIFASSM